MASAKYNCMPGENEGLTRRNLLRAAPAVGFTALIAGASPVEALIETPVAALFRQWTSAKAAEDAAFAANEDSATTEAAWQTRYDIETRLMAAPCETARDWLMKISAWTNFGDCGGPDRAECAKVWAEARDLVGA